MIAPSPAPTWRTLLRRGDIGADVRAWQERLLAVGLDPGTPDSYFGPITEAATRELQRVAEIAVDGIAGPRSRAAAELMIPPTTPATYPDLGTLLLATAAADLGQGEDPPGSNDGPFVRRIFDGTGVEPPASYCAAAVRYWLRRAAGALGVEPPIPGSVGAKATMVQLQRAGRWYDVAALREGRAVIRPGMIVVWHRGLPGAWTGHEGVASRSVGALFWTIEANAGNLVDQFGHSVNDPLLLGAGWVDAPPRP